MQSLLLLYLGVNKIDSLNEVRGEIRAIMICLYTHF